MNITFSPPNIGDDEINELVNTLKSWWITSGPKVQLFEQEISNYCWSEYTACVSSAASGLELTLRILWIGVGDEVIIPAYTYTATASSVIHVGATPIMCDIQKNNFQISIQEIEKKISQRTKAIIPVDFAGFPCDYDAIYQIINDKKHLYKAKESTLQENINRIVVISDSAHSFWAIYKQKIIWNPTICDFSIFSFHAVKNLTTAEWWAICFWNIEKIPASYLYRQIKLYSLQWQTKDALEKNKTWSWDYDIVFPWYKMNMTDIQASIWIKQLEKYPKLLLRRKEIYELYSHHLKDTLIRLPNFIHNDNIWSFHIFPITIPPSKRDSIVTELYKKWISTNVHFKPLPLFTAYKNLWYKINNFPLSYETFLWEISLPIYPQLRDDQVIYICETLKKLI